MKYLLGASAVCVTYLFFNPDLLLLLDWSPEELRAIRAEQQRLAERGEACRRFRWVADAALRDLVAGRRTLEDAAAAVTAAAERDNLLLLKTLEKRWPTMPVRERVALELIDHLAGDLEAGLLPGGSAATIENLSRELATWPNASSDALAIVEFGYPFPR